METKNRPTWEVHSYLNDKFTPESIKRLSDGEIFFTDDYVTNGTKMKGHIIRFELDTNLNEVFVYTDWSNIGMGLDDIYKTTKLPSAFQNGDSVYVQFDSKQRLFGKITKVSFTQSKVLYDVEVQILLPAVNYTTEYGSNNDQNRIHYTRVHSIDSSFVFRDELPNNSKQPKPID